LEFSDAELMAADAKRCRLIGEVAHQPGLEGILAPSATGVGTVLAVFFDRLRADSHIRDLDYESWIGPPTADLLERLWARNEMSEEEAIALSVEAQHATGSKSVEVSSLLQDHVASLSDIFRWPWALLPTCYQLATKS
jgi:hypothetical protein